MPNKIWVWIRKHILHRKERPVVPVILDNNPLSISSYLEEYGDTPVDKGLRSTFQPKPVTRPSKAIHQDLGKFVAGKGKGQHKYYRASVKAKKKPEED